MLTAEGCFDVKLKFAQPIPAMNSVYLEADLYLSLNGGHYK